MSKNNYEYHHIGIPTKIPQEGERYSSTFKMYTTGGHNAARIQWHRFEENCPLHPLIQTLPHVAFKVDHLDEAIAGNVVLMEPYYPFAGYRTAVIEMEGAPVELIETSLSEDEIWNDAVHKHSLIYPKNK